VAAGIGQLPSERFSHLLLRLEKAFSLARLCLR